MTAWLKEVLEISVRTSISCTAQSLSTRPGMLSGPTALHGLILHRVLRQLEIDRAPGHLEMCAVLVQVCRSVSQIMSRRGWVHLAGMCHRHWPVAGACDGLNGLPQGPGHCHWSYCWFFEHVDVLHFWELPYLLIWMPHLGFLAAREPQLSSMASSWLVWWWSWWLSYHLWTSWCKQSLFRCAMAPIESWCLYALPISKRRWQAYICYEVISLWISGKVKLLGGEVKRRD